MAAVKGLKPMPGILAGVLIKTGEQMFASLLVKPLTGQMERAFREW